MLNVYLLLSVALAQELTLIVKGPLVVNGKVRFHLSTPSGFHTSPKKVHVTLKGPGWKKLRKTIPLFGEPSNPESDCLPVRNPAKDCPPYKGPIYFQGMQLKLAKGEKQVLDRPGKWQLDASIDGMTVKSLNFTVVKKTWPLPELSSKQLQPSYQHWYTPQESETTLIARKCWIDTDELPLCVNVHTNVSLSHQQTAHEKFLKSGNPTRIKVDEHSLFQSRGNIRWYSENKIIDVFIQKNRDSYKKSVLKELLQTLPPNSFDKEP